MSSTYKDAGVDIEAGAHALSRIRGVVRKTWRHIPGRVIDTLGTFAAVVEMQGGYFALAADGVGTKVRIAAILDQHESVGQDLVGMNVNDVAATGIPPIMFLDYIGMGKQIPERTERIVAGISRACDLSDVALVGGEMAEMPCIYAPDDYDLAGFALGAAPRGARLCTGERVKSGVHVWGVPSSGLHSNGFSLVRKVFGINGDARAAARVLAQTYAALDGRTLGEELLLPTALYPRLVKRLVGGPYDIMGIAHITGGGLQNIQRVLPPACAVRIDARSWDMPTIFRILQQKGRISSEEMCRTFNCGIGLVVISPSNLSGEGLIQIGEVLPARSGTPRIVLCRS